ncbi:MAG: hypothetical protein WBD36_14555 [Bacteroidota bacterium]
MRTHNRRQSLVIGLMAILCGSVVAQTSLQPVTPPDQRGRIDAERSGTHDAGNIRTVFYNYGMVGDYPANPINVDLSVFHSVEVPKGSGMNYCDGITPYVLAKIQLRGGQTDYIMETGFRERQQLNNGRVMRFEPRPGYLQADPSLNRGRSIALSNDPRTWPNSWPDRVNEPGDPGWPGSWSGYFGKEPKADQESYYVMDDNFYDAWDYYPDTRDTTRRGLGLRVDVRGFQWANPAATNVIFWHYDITNESTTSYQDNIIFGLYMDSGVGGSTFSCDGYAESDDDNAYYTRSLGLNLTYTWDIGGHGADLRSNCSPAGYLGYAYLETPGNPHNGIDDDEDGIVDELRDSGPGTLIVGKSNILSYVATHYDTTKFAAFYGSLESRPAVKAGRWWTGDENMNWVADYDDVGRDGVPGTKDAGEGDGMPTPNEPDFDATDLNESDQIGLTGFKMNRIRGPQATDPVDGIVFFMDSKRWPETLFNKFSDPNPAARFDTTAVLGYNIGFLFASGPFTLPAGSNERFSLALAYGEDYYELQATVKTVQQIYNANYRFAAPPPLPRVTAETGDRFVRLSWSDVSERGIDPVTLQNDFEGYKIYRSTDPEFRDPKTVTNARGTALFGNGKPIAVFDIKDGRRGYSNLTIDGTAYYLGNESGLTHTFVDTTVMNGQTYYYAVCSYDYGNDSLVFFPSENSIGVSRTPRGGTVLAANVVEVRPEPTVKGYVPASASEVRHVTGKGTAAIGIQMVNSSLVPDGKTYFLKFHADNARKIRAVRYEMTDSAAGKVLFEYGNDLTGQGTGVAESGILPVVNVPQVVTVDAAGSGWQAGSTTNIKLVTTYLDVVTLPRDLRRFGYPDDLLIVFANTVQDTSIDGDLRSRATKFKMFAVTDTGMTQIKYQFNDVDGDGTLSTSADRIDVVCYPYDDPFFDNGKVWRISVDTTGWYLGPPTIVPPKSGDSYLLKLTVPAGEGDVYAFSTSAQRVDNDVAKSQTEMAPYVVPNPYAGAASFEPERFAVTGRGERRMEFRGIPANAVVRIYTVSGNLVQTLYHDGSMNGAIPWNLRTKDNLDVAPGLYMYHVQAEGFSPFIGKFAIIK